VGAVALSCSPCICHWLHWVRGNRYFCLTASYYVYLLVAYLSEHNYISRQNGSAELFLTEKFRLTPAVHNLSEKIADSRSLFSCRIVSLKRYSNWSFSWSSTWHIRGRRSGYIHVWIRIQNKWFFYFFLPFKWLLVNQCPELHKYAPIVVFSYSKFNSFHDFCLNWWKYVSCKGMLGVAGKINDGELLPFNCFSAYVVPLWNYKGLFVMW